MGEKTFTTVAWWPGDLKYGEFVYEGKRKATKYSFCVFVSVRMTVISRAVEGEN